MAFAHVFLNIMVILMKNADRSVLSMKSVVVTRLVFGTSVKILVQEFAVKQRSAMSSIISQSVRVLKV